MQRTVLAVNPKAHKRFKAKADSLGLKLKAAADQAIELWIAHQTQAESQKNLQK